MTRLRNAIWLSAVLLLSGIFSCTKQEEIPSAAGGEVAITFSTAPQTKATTPGDGVAADGGGIYVDGSDNPDLHVFLFNTSDGSLAARYPDPLSGVPASCATHTATTATLLFKDVPEGSYTVYAVANTEGSGAWGMSGFSAWTAISNASDLEALTFTPLSAGAHPVVTDRLPLSAKGNLSVSSRHTGEVSLELLRCVGKVTLELLDQTDNGLSLTNLSVTLHNMSATTGYLIPHDPDQPAGAGYGNITIGDPSVTFTDKKASYPTLVFPQAEDEHRCYSCDISFESGGVSKSFTGLPIQNYRAENVASLLRNQNLVIQIRISEKPTVSFNFQFGDWTHLDESVTFD